MKSSCYKAACYLRISKDDGESQSIQNQRDFIFEYAKREGIDIKKVYIDDGISGTTFDRPGFLEMIEDIKKGKINMVITKDLSRLGRDYIQTGYYLEKFFPQMKVRYIAINDGIDSEVDNDFSPFKSVINDLYAKDISKKVRAALNTKKIKGNFIGAFAPYGYKKDEENRGRLLVDEKYANVVRRIFKMCIEGKTLDEIAKTLTQEKIPTPMSVMRGKDFYNWNKEQVRRIIKNKVYIGYLCQSKTTKVNYKLKRRKYNKEEDWIIIKDAHEKIVPDEDFYLANSKLKKQAPRRLSGLVFCGACGNRMTFLTDGKKRVYLICSLWKKNKRLCTSHCMSEKYLIEAISLGQNPDEALGKIEKITIHDGKEIEIDYK